jgi:hypothetical protein
MRTAAEIVRQARVRAGLTQTQLAKRGGTSQPVISAYENGQRDPTISTLQRVVAATGSTVRFEVVRQPSGDLPPATTDHERSQRLVDVLLLADAIPHRPGQKRQFPRITSKR